MTEITEEREKKKKKNRSTYVAGKINYSDTTDRERKYLINRRRHDEKNTRVL